MVGVFPEKFDELNDIGKIAFLQIFQYYQVALSSGEIRENFVDGFPYRRKIFENETVGRKILGDDTNGVRFPNACPTDQRYRVFACWTFFELVD